MAGFLKELMRSVFGRSTTRPGKPRAPVGTAAAARPKTSPRTAPGTVPGPATAARPAAPGALPARGQFGPSATVEIDPGTVGTVRMSYSPSTDGDPDPGEIVWTWVPYQERDGRGKDRPVLVVATQQTGTVLAVQLTSKAHDGDGEFVALGSGPWDRDGRPSWVNLDRVFQVHHDGMRREATALDEKRFGTVRTALQRRYRWS